MVRRFYGDDEFRHCEACGLPTEVEYRQRGFETSTGQPRLERFHRCPRAGWRGLWMHTNQRIHHWGPMPDLPED